jgi:tRNA(Ile)-lysidine synthase
MERHAPNIRAALIELAEASRAAADSFDAVAGGLLPDTNHDREIEIPRQTLAAAPVALRPHVFRLAITRLLGDAREFERRHYTLLAAAADAATGATFMLPRGLTLTVDADALHLTRGAIAQAAVDEALAHDLPFEGLAGAWQMRIVPAGEASMGDGGADLRLPEGAIVRGRLPGDRVRTRAGAKKLGDWYTDRKIPRRERDSAPVIAYGAQVLWTPWGALAELPHGRAWRVVSRRLEA